MNDNQEKHYRMYVTVQNTMDKNTPIWTGNPAMTEAKNKLDSEIELLEETDKKAVVSTKGGTRAKEQVRGFLENKILVLSGILHAHAAIENDQELMGMLETAESSLAKYKETELVTYGKRVLEKAKGIEAILAKKHAYGKADMTETETTLEEFDDLLGTPKQRMAAINAAKKSLDEHSKNITDLLNNVLDKLMLRYKFSNKEFYNEYQQSRTIID